MPGRTTRLHLDAASQPACGARGSSTTAERQLVTCWRCRQQHLPAWATAPLGSARAGATSPP